MRRIIRFLIAAFGFLAYLQAVAQPNPQKLPVTGNLGDILGSPSPYAAVNLQLQNCPSPVRIVGSNVIVQSAVALQANSAGLVNSTVWPNDLITCNGTTGSSEYAVDYIVGGVPAGQTQCYQVTSTQGAWNLNTQQPIPCSQTPPNPQDAQYRNLTVNGCLSVDGGACVIPIGAGDLLSDILPGWTVIGTGITQEVTAPGGFTANRLSAKSLNTVHFPTTFADLQAAVTACGAAPCMIAIDANLSVTSNFTIPANVSLAFWGGRLQPSTGITLTVLSKINAPTTQIFGGAGTIAGLSEVRPEWLGASTTIAQAVAALPASGGKVLLGAGIYTSGYTSTAISKPGVQIEGAGMPTFNSGYLALTGGTIIQGTLPFIQGADRLVVRNLGVDVGASWVAAGHAAADGLAVANQGQIVGTAQVQSPLIENVACLGSSSTAPYHCMLVENVNSAMIHNVRVVGNTHGLVLKGTNSTIDGAWSSWHSSTSVDIKSDTYAPGHDDVITNVKIASLLAPGDTGPLLINTETVGGTGLPIYNISVSHVQAVNVGVPGEFAAIDIAGKNDAYPAYDINLSDITIDWPGGSTSGYACMILTQSVQRVQMNGLNCKNYYYAIYHAFPDSTTNDFTLTGSRFEGIANSALLTHGRWTISGNSFKDITVNAISMFDGNVTLGENSCTNCGAYYNRSGGTWTYDFHGYQGNAVTPTVSPAILSKTEAMTGGVLSVAFLNNFSGPPDCSANVISTNAQGSTTTPQLWISLLTNSVVVWHASDASFNGNVSWHCFGSFQ